MRFPAEVSAAIAETEHLTREFGDEKLRKMNARFDRQVAVAERRAEPVVALVVAIAVILAVALTAALSGGVK